MIWFLPKIWRGIKKVFGFIGRVLGISPSPVNTGQGPHLKESPDIGNAPDIKGDIEDKLKTLNDLLRKELISEEEYAKKKQELLDRL